MVFLFGTFRSKFFMKIMNTIIKNTTSFLINVSPFLLFLLGLEKVFCNELDAYHISKVVVEGVYRVPKDKVNISSFLYLGQKIDAYNSTLVIKNIYNTGYFDNIKLFHHNNSLVIKVIENL
jgi:outer membrane protein assembly factor BamA